MGFQSKHPSYALTQSMAKTVKSNRKLELEKIFKSDKIIRVLMKDDYTAIQLLLFHYLGFFEKINLPNTKKKILLSIVFKTQGFENIRKKLSNITRYETIENLEILQDLFKELEMAEPLKKVEKKLLRK